MEISNQDLKFQARMVFACMGGMVFSFVRMSLFKTSSRGLKALEKEHFGADIHDMIHKNGRKL